MKPQPGLRFTSVVAVVAAAAYPFAIASGLDHAGPRTVAAALLALVVVVAVASSGRGSPFLPLLARRFGLLVVVAMAAVATGHPAALTLLPTLTNLWLLWIFGSTLRDGPPLVEQFARALHDAFPDFLAPYCRRVTWMWCGYFVVNATVSGVLALAAPAHVWALYTGAISYAVIAVLVAGEYLFHKRHFRFYERGWADGLWRRVWPPERTELGRRTLAWQLALERETERR